MATIEHPVADVVVNGDFVSLPVVPVVRDGSGPAATASASDGSTLSAPFKVACPQEVLDAIYGKKSSEEKKKAYEASLQRWAYPLHPHLPLKLA